MDSLRSSRRTSTLKASTLDCSPRPSLLFLRRALAALLTCALLVLIVTLLANENSDTGKVDFIQYWSAANLLREGRSPYDTALMSAFQQRHLSQHPTLLWIVPLGLPLVMPLALLPLAFASAVWLLWGAGCILAAVLIFRALLLPRQSSWWWVAVMSTFYPFGLALSLGQITPLMLLSLALSWRLRSRGAGFLSGGVLSLTLMKPHLLWGLYLLVMLDALRGKRAEFLGLLSGAALLSLAAYCIRPEIFIEYLSSFRQAPPFYWKNPTIGSWLQLWWGQGALVRSVPTLIAGIGVFLLWTLYGAQRSDLLRLVVLPLSLLASPYGWEYDHMFMVPSLLWLLATSRPRFWWYLAGLLLCNTVTMSLGVQGQEVMIWYPCVVLLLVWDRWRMLNDQQPSLA